MRCPYCGTLDKDHVLDSRPIREGAAIRRRRECESCLGRFTTFEEVEELRLMVLKNNGAREPFERGKLRRAIELACKKRPVPDAALSQLVDELERALYARAEREVSSQAIGELLMEKLRLLDTVAYVRFASVYRQFEDVREFRELVERLPK
ncbi:transcriptional regulator NrdR [Armatimonas rosea]|jgi:transcriptional repressor NrdR|uniref:Transcriptional repressor NrdR n=1 Tax=Armatimonas rosea TaxID=685828 RepID=A0A7W9SR43_ARMRO|nr:transcriptional regulator NrdR [Armatimonas rosea]MBB6051281.1 transcriptional repressor NrdR [Armatimonas rosea]